MICPYCKEGINDGATTCPVCRRTVFNEDPQKNALIAVVGFVVVFFILWGLIKWWSGRQVESIMRDSKVQSEQIMKDLFKE